MSEYDRLAAHPFKWFAERFLIYVLVSFAAMFGFTAGAYLGYHCALNVCH